MKYITTTLIIACLSVNYMVAQNDMYFVPNKKIKKQKITQIEKNINVTITDTISWDSDVIEWTFDDEVNPDTVYSVDFFDNSDEYVYSRLLNRFENGFYPDYIDSYYFYTNPFNYPLYSRNFYRHIYPFYYTYFDYYTPYIYEYNDWYAYCYSPYWYGYSPYNYGISYTTHTGTRNHGNITRRGVNINTNRNLDGYTFSRKGKNDNVRGLKNGEMNSTRQNGTRTIGVRTNGLGTTRTINKNINNDNFQNQQRIDSSNSRVPTVNTQRSYDYNSSSSNFGGNRSVGSSSRSGGNSGVRGLGGRR